jgi:hypothetical protein
VATLNKLTNENKHIKLENTVKKRQKTKEKSQSIVINTEETGRWIGCLRTLLKGGGAEGGLAGGTHELKGN